MKINEIIAEDVPSAFINSEIKKDKQWKKMGSGVTASVWRHMEDPTTVVKVVGGGMMNSRPSYRSGAIAFVHFCVDHGHESPHFPIIHGINVDDDDVVQIRLETLLPIVNYDIATGCANIASDVKEYGVKDYRCVDSMNSLDRLLHHENTQMRGHNSAASIAEACDILVKNAPHYAKAYKLEVLRLDLHFGNWMMRGDNTIVAADPWYAI